MSPVMHVASYLGPCMISAILVDIVDARTPPQADTHYAILP